MRRLGVGIRARSPGLALAPAVAAIIENENTRAGFEQRSAVFEPMADVPRVAVAEQINEVFSRGVCVGGKKTTAQYNAIGRLEMNDLKRAAPCAPARLQL